MQPSGKCDGDAFVYVMVIDYSGQVGLRDLGKWQTQLSDYSVRQTKLTYVGFRAHVKIASRIVSYRFGKMLR